MKSIAVIGMLVLMTAILSACAGASPTRTTPLVKETASADQSRTIIPTEEEAIAVQLPTPTFLPEEEPPRGVEREFTTDFSKHTVPYAEILSGGPPKDGIPAIDEPHYVRVNEADSWLKPVEPVILVEVGQEARAYPLQILIWHEIVNDTINGLPLTITFCPLCNTAIAFERRFNGQILDFGTTGRLRYSNLIMYDRQSETWWQQANGEAIAGHYAGSQLLFYPAVIVAWEEFKSRYPEGTVLSRETGFSRSYSENPYIGYDDVRNPPFLYNGPRTPGELPPMARVLTLDLDGEAVAYPYETLEKVQVVNDVVGGQPIVVLWASGTASALDTESIANGRNIGSTTAFSRLLNGLLLGFKVIDDRITDQETGSEWNILGKAVKGELAGSQLTPVVAINHFWFSWAAFRPETKIYQP